MVRIFIDPGHGGRDSGAIGNGLQEKNITLQISQCIRDYLLSDYHNVEVNMSRTSDTFVSLSDRSRKANQWSADYFVSIHINAGGGTGFESYVHSSRVQRTVSLQTIIHKLIMSHVNVVDRGRKSANFAVLRHTSMPAILTESAFIDHTRDAENLKRIAFIRQVARGHVEGMVQAFDLKRKANSLSSDRLFKVQSGSFQKHQNAVDLKNRLEQQGYQAYFQFEASFYRVQVGAFSKRENADSLANELRNRGFDAIIV
ncbi:N-acetylmuramoyl-L-alanine amidase [Alkalicoccobacillus porphyridii]|uniref:N-acetylmuramoyl-L-alanine amidase n=1 Tax=Alkalicoccobacillus porphyridii TaxID=2597270 RepID=A0A554A053_9BACI|nr:N-acetylmuramoyl-L-alanine amidase [Alkalicoccobacillus porphyridii]TSB47016.1 N-acetylmuramoyl-L-alanine amidase [Alkalicoccobacillus porphyridii]